LPYNLPLCIEEAYETFLTSKPSPMAKLPAVVKGVTLLIYDLLISSTCSWHI
jgi:hypothetical protein